MMVYVYCLRCLALDELTKYAKPFIPGLIYVDVAVHATLVFP